MRGCAASSCGDRGYAHWREVRDHGAPEGLVTPMGVLLNIADMSVDSQGDEVGFRRRLDDVAGRYGKDSDQWRECARMVRLLKETPEWRTIAGQRSTGLYP